MTARNYLLTAAAGLALSGCTSFSSIHDVNTMRATTAGEDVKDIASRTDVLQTEKQFAPAVAAPPPVSMRKTFQVFFDWDRYNISQSAAEIIRHVAADARLGGVNHIDLVGHTDSSGPDAYNQKMSERRADEVKAEFINNGFEAGEISSMGVGEASQLVPTADGVREPQNRRTEIILK